MPKKFRLKYVVEDHTDGVLRFYFRRKGQKKVRLPGHPGTDEFKAAYYRALEGSESTRPGKPAPVGKTLLWLCQHYWSSADYARLNSRTRRVRRQILESCLAEPIKPDSEKLFGAMPLSAVTARAVAVLRDRKAGAPEAANGRVKALRQVFAWARLPHVDRWHANPAADVPYFRGAGQGHHSWTLEEVGEFEDRHPVGTAARLALALLLYTGQRRSDIVRFGRQHIRNGWIRFTQVKGAERKPVTLEIPVHPELQTIIDATECGDLAFLVNEFGRPFSEAGFGNWFRKRCNEAGLAHCSAHGLRKAAASLLADLGATDHQIMAITGHQTLKEVSRYTRAARQKRLARDAMGLLDRRRAAGD